MSYTKISALRLALYAYLIAHTGQETVPISKDTMVTNNTDAPIALVGPTRITSSRVCCTGYYDVYFKGSCDTLQRDHEFAMFRTA